MVPAAIAVWYICLILGFYSLSILDFFCPPELMMYGAWCTAKWHGIATEVFIVFFASISACLIVTSSYLIAPFGKKEIAIISFIVGLVVAFIMAYASQAWLLFGIVSIAGALTTVFWSIKETHSKKLKMDGLHPPFN